MVATYYSVVEAQFKMKTIHLYGVLREKFGASYQLDVRDAKEAIRFLMAQIEGFKEEIEKGDWHIIRGELDSGDSVSEETAHISLGNTTDIHLVPAVDGAGGLVDIVTGITLVAWNIAIGNWAGVKSGWNKVTGGFADLIGGPKVADYSGRSGANERPSFLFDGATNTSTQGLPVPVIYGRVRTGSVVISAGLTSEEVK